MNGTSTEGVKSSPKFNAKTINPEGGQGESVANVMAINPEAVGLTDKASDLHIPGLKAREREKV